MGGFETASGNIFMKTAIQLIAVMIVKSDGFRAGCYQPGAEGSLFDQTFGKPSA